MNELRGKGKYSHVYSFLLNGVLVAMKQFHVDVKKEVFDKECDILQSLNHPNILKYIDRTIHVLFTELLNGNLEDFMPPKSTCIKNKKSILLDIAKGLDYIHSLKNPIIHRDIKPANIFIRTNTQHSLQAIIGDFGFAVICPSHDHNFFTTFKVGSPIYMAHEIVSRPTIDTNIEYTSAVDIWSFAVVCWELITEDDPYNSFNNLYKFTQYIINGGHLSFDNYCNFNGFDIVDDKKLFDLIEQCWNPDPSQRPSAKKFIEILS